MNSGISELPLLFTQVILLECRGRLHLLRIPSMLKKASFKVQSVLQLTNSLRKNASITKTKPITPFAFYQLLNLDSGIIQLYPAVCSLHTWWNWFTCEIRYESAYNWNEFIHMVFELNCVDMCKYRWRNCCTWKLSFRI